MAGSDFSQIKFCLAGSDCDWWLSCNGTPRYQGRLLRDNLAGLIEPIMGSAGTITLALPQSYKISSCTLQSIGR